MTIKQHETDNGKSVDYGSDSGDHLIDNCEAETLPAMAETLTSME